jgi:hypothetical protein
MYWSILSVCLRAACAVLGGAWCPRTSDFGQFIVMTWTGAVTSILFLYFASAAPCAISISQRYLRFDFACILGIFT